MARSIAGFNNDIVFEPLNSEKAPSCDGCKRITYVVYQATCCGAYFCEACKIVRSSSPTCLRCNRSYGNLSYDFNETQKEIESKYAVGINKRDAHIQMKGDVWMLIFAVACTRRFHANTKNASKRFSARIYNTIMKPVQIERSSVNSARTISEPFTWRSFTCPTVVRTFLRIVQTNVGRKLQIGNSQSTRKPARTNR